MKNCINSAILIVFLCTPSFAQRCCSPHHNSYGHVVRFHYVTPYDVLSGTARYVGGVGHRVLHGVGSIIQAPFVTPYSVPTHSRTYRYIPGRYIPGQFYEIHPHPRWRPTTPHRKLERIPAPPTEDKPTPVPVPDPNFNFKKRPPRYVFRF